MKRMYDKILVPLDGSKVAEMVLPYAQEVSVKLGADIILVGVSEPTLANTRHLYDSYLTSVIEQVQRKLKNLGVKEEVKVHSETLLGKPSDEILYYADKQNVSLIAMTSRGVSIPGPWPLGNIVTKVVRATNKPLLLVRAPVSKAALQENKLIKRILLPLDGSEVGESAILYTQELAQALGSEIILFQVLPVATTQLAEAAIYPTRISIKKFEEESKASALVYLDGVGKPLKESGIRTSNIVMIGSPANQIIDYAKDNAVDLIAMSTHGRTGIGRWVFGSVTDKVLHAGDTGVLVIRAPTA
ncbi:universal stress protein [Chloroflexota bacterium]